MRLNHLLVGSLLGLTLSASAKENIIEDVGTDLPFDPYTHTRGLTEGRMEGFRELHVQPDDFADALKPTKPLQPKLPGVTSVDWDFGEGTGAGLQFRIALDAEVLGKTPVSSVQDALVAAGHTVEADGETALLVTAGDAGLLAALATPLAVDGGLMRRVADVGSASYAEAPVVEEAPEEDSLDKTPPVAEEAPAEEGEAEAEVETTWIPIAFEPPLPKAASGKGILLVDNNRSSYADVVINNEKVGRIGPYATGYVHDVPKGSYTVEFTVQNGFSWTVDASTVDKVDVPRQPGVTNIGKPGPGNTKK